MVERNLQQNPESYKIGEWFAPFKNYEEVRSNNRADEDFEQKDFPFEIAGAGSFDGLTFRSSADGDGDAIILTPTFTIPFNEHDIKPLEARLGTRLVGLSFKTLGWKDNIAVSLRLGNEGEVYSNRFYPLPNSSVSTAEWNTWHNKYTLIGGLYVPEREYVLSHMQARIAEVI